MTGPQQADADPVAVVLDWLTGHADVATLLGGPEHVTGISETPWPHLVVDEGTGGDLRDYRWDAEYEVVLELWSHPNGAPGKAAMRDLMMRLLRLAADLPDQQTVDATTPVVSRVRPSGTYAWQPLTNGQLKLVAGLYITIRPPSTLPTP